MSTPETLYNKDDEINDKLYDLAEVNVQDTQTGKEMYAILPHKLIAFIKQYGIQERIDEGALLQGSVNNLRTSEPKLNEYVDGYNRCYEVFMQKIQERRNVLTTKKEKE